MLKKFAIVCGAIILLSPALALAQQFTLEWVVEGLAWYFGDMDGDNVGEFAIASGDTTRFYDGSTHNLKWTSSLGGVMQKSWFAGWYPYFMPPAVDFTGDGVKDIFLRDPFWNNMLRIVDVVNDTLIFDLSYACDHVHFRNLADVDGDDELELVIYRFVIPDWDSTYVYSTGLSTMAFEGNQVTNVITHGLCQNYPNPFRSPATTIRYSIQEGGRVSLKVYDRAGRLTRTLTDEHKRVGDYTAEWACSDDKGNKVATGVYFYQLKVGDYVSTKKAVVVR